MRREEVGLIGGSAVLVLLRQGICDGCSAESDGGGKGHGGGGGDGVSYFPTDYQTGRVWCVLKLQK